MSSDEVEILHALLHDLQAGWTFRGGHSFQPTRPLASSASFAVTVLCVT
jgi:hypothetical protein